METLAEWKSWPKEESLSNLTVVAVLFACSLLAAFVLFKILQSTAAIQKKEYQVGGAAAGFLVIYMALYGSYSQLQKAQLASSQAQLAACQAQRDADEHELTIQGIVEPSVKDAQVVFAVNSVNLGDNGRFRLNAKGVDPAKDSLSLYVITEKTHNYYQIFPGDDTANLKINVGEK
ncbi:hypothetical protein SBA6_590043 [Candidatus Sulfopaludibacter sp. SbA6]|nr:hypothetical protein SBA6_590043 [Candidatus Sulfopaludibacter sp. SbA6]